MKQQRFVPFKLLALLPFPPTRFTLPDGTIAEVSYTADEEGFKPQSDLLPIAPPLPAHALEQIQFAEQQRAAGVVFEK